MMTFFQKITGLIILVGCLLATYYFETSSTSSGLLRIIHWPAILLTGLGPVGVIILCFDRFAVKEALEVVLKNDVHKTEEQTVQEMAVFQRISHDFYLKGARAVEGIPTGELSVFVQRIVERIGLRMPLNDVRGLLERERLKTEMRFSQAHSLYSAAVKITPSVGMLGTIMGMIQLLSHLKDPSEIGSGMSLALLTTFFGLFFSLVLWSPFQHKVERLAVAIQKQYDQANHWLDLLEQRKPAQYLSEIANRETPGSSRPGLDRNGTGGTLGTRESGQHPSGKGLRNA